MFQKRIRKFLLLSVLFLILNQGYAQRWPFEFWHEGKVVLIEGDTLKGLFKYDLQKDLLEYSYRDQQPVAFTARKVLYFEIFDKGARRYRRFFTLPFEATQGYKTPIFFELLEEGKITLLAREFLEYRTQNSMYMTYSRVVLSHKFFFLKENGDIEQFIGGKNDLLDRMGKQADEVEKFIRQNRLSIDDKLDFTRIIDYYNSFFEH